MPQVLESHPDLDTADKIKLRLETMMIGTAENRAFYDIAPRYKNAEGNWVEVDEANFPHRRCGGGASLSQRHRQQGYLYDSPHAYDCFARAGELSSFRTRSRRMACTSV